MKKKSSLHVGLRQVGEVQLGWRKIARTLSGGRSVVVWIHCGNCGR